MLESVLDSIINKKRRKSGVLECGRLLWTGRVSVTSACTMVSEQLEMLTIALDFVQLKLINHVRGFK